LNDFIELYKQSELIYPIKYHFIIHELSLVFITRVTWWVPLVWLWSSHLETFISEIVFMKI